MTHPSYSALFSGAFYACILLQHSDRSTHTTHCFSTFAALLVQTDSLPASIFPVCPSLSAYSLLDREGGLIPSINLATSPASPP